MTGLIAKLRTRPHSEAFYDITFRLPDGGTVYAHRLILAIASPYFEAQFFGLLASDHSGTIVIKDGDSDAFRRLLDFIYNSGPLDWDMDNIEYWSLLEAAHMFLVPKLIDYCNKKLSDFLTNVVDDEELIAHVNRASQLSIFDDIARTGVLAIKARMKNILPTKSWVTLEEHVVLELVKDTNLKVSEGDIFEGIIRWCRASTNSEEEAILKFQQKFADKIIAKNISNETFVTKIGPSGFLSDELFKNWTYEIMKSKVPEASRFALIPYKIKRTLIDKEDFLEPRADPSLPDQGSDYDLWKTIDEFADVVIDIKIYQKISVGLHVPRGKFGIMLETVHTARDGGDISCITERVTVKMVAKSRDGTVMKKLFKPIEDSCREIRDSRTNIFVLSKNKEERLYWNVMEVVVIIDRRPQCHIKGISGETFAQTVCTAPSRAYMDRALRFSFDIGTSIKACVKEIAEKLGSKDLNLLDLQQWLYIFTKGYVSNFRSRRALPNDYWTAETVGDYMRCKVINFPIGVQNEEMRRDAFRTWIISRKMADEKEKDKKNLFVCTYNPITQRVKYAKNFSVNVDTKVESLGLMEYITLGRLKITEDFFTAVVAGTDATSDSRIFIRRVFPIQDELNEKHQGVVVTEVVRGDTLTHIDDCHVLVIQEGHGVGVDFDKFIVSKIREIEVLFEPKEEDSGVEITLLLDPQMSLCEVREKLGESIGTEAVDIELFKCSAAKSMTKRPTELPVKIENAQNLEFLLEGCTVGPKTVFYRLNIEDKFL